MSELTAYEQLLLELVNRARLDPAAEAARYGIALNKDLPAGTLAGGARQVLAPNELLADAARAHSQWMIDTDRFSHAGVGGSNPGDRMADAGYVFAGNWTWGENIAWMGTTGTPDVASYTEGLHRNLFLSAGHRVNILNGSFRELGTGIEEGRFTSGSTTYNAVMATENFAKSGTDVFITGVAYTDHDGDRFYDVGEGTSGIAVSVTAGEINLGQDFTAGAGGYAVAVASTNAVVTFSGGPLSGPVTVTISGGGLNAKVDLVDGDTIFSSASTVLGDGALDLRLLGVANLNGTGNAQNNVLTGNAGANILDGGAGNDRLIGGKGSDKYWIDSLGDVVVEAAGAGFNSVNATVTTRLGANVEYLYLRGTEAINGTGNGLANTILGNSANNIIAGGAGHDRLTGGAGNDSFLFNTAPSGAANRDIITDFTNAAGNNDLYLLENAIFTKLAKLGAMSAAHFRVGTKALDANDYVIYNKTVGALYYDSNGSANGGMVHVATLTNKPALSPADFFIV